MRFFRFFPDISLRGDRVRRGQKALPNRALTDERRPSCVCPAVVLRGAVRAFSSGLPSKSAGSSKFQHPRQKVSEQAFVSLVRVRSAFQASLRCPGFG